jgi:hypothetical protein
MVWYDFFEIHWAVFIVDILSHNCQMGDCYVLLCLCWQINVLKHVILIVMFGVKLRVKSV